MINAKDREITGLQALRAFAAIAVVGHHALRAVTVHASAEMPLRPSVLPGWLIEAGTAGVDLFFVLSGFLMVYIAGSYVEGRRPVSHFLQQRVLRVWPMYVLITLFTLKPALMNWWLHGERAFDLSATRLLGFFFIPTFNERHLIQPIVGVGWTLSYEAMFYLCFAAAILLAGKRLFGALCGLLAGVFLIGLVLPASSVWHGFLSDPITLEFLYGAAIASFLNWKDRSPAGSLLLIALGLVTFCVSSALGFIDSPLRPLTFGVAAALIFIGVLRLDAHVRWPRFIVMLGNASYSIYLVHILVIYQYGMPYMTRAVRKFHLELNADFVALLLVAGGVGVGVLCHFLIERPLTVFLMRRRQGRRPADLPVSMTPP